MLVRLVVDLYLGRIELHAPERALGYRATPSTLPRLKASPLNGAGLCSEDSHPVIVA